MSYTPRFIEKIFNTLVLVASMAILLVLSLELLPTAPAVSKQFILVFHLVVCSVFLADYVVRFLCSTGKIHFIFHNLFFLVVSIPWLNIIEYAHHTIPYDLHLLVRIIPVARGIYGIALMIGWMTRSRVTTLFVSYITTLIAATYFAAIAFYTLERGVNPMVKTFWDAAVTWACMNVTTVGSNIFAVTKTGQVLAVFLAAAGMMMFPIFTAYVTTKFQEKRQKGISPPEVTE